jgi:hypothetical protein
MDVEEVEEVEEVEPLDKYLSTLKSSTPYEPVEVTIYGEFVDSTSKHNEKSFQELISKASIITNTTVPIEAAIKPKTKEGEKKKHKEEAPPPQIIHRANEIIIGSKTYTMPENAPPTFKTAYMMNDREQFVEFIQQFMETTHGEEIKQDSELTCDNIFSRGEDFSLLTHQKIVKDYMNLYTPYRGLLLYHGLGSGKTCTSIAIAEGMKSSKRIIVMVPASLKKSYLAELKKCGDVMYRKDKNWVWVDVDVLNTDLIHNLSAVLGLAEDLIIKNKGAFLIDVTSAPNYGSLSLTIKQTTSLAKDNKKRKRNGEAELTVNKYLEEQQALLNEQIDNMISNKYTFISYNGLKKLAYSRIPRPEGQQNLFDNSVVIIDEAHNLVSRIINKLGDTEFSENATNIDRKKITQQSMALAKIIKEYSEKKTVATADKKMLDEQLLKQLKIAKKAAGDVNLISNQEIDLLFQDNNNSENIKTIIGRLNNQPSTSPKHELPLSVMIYRDLMRAKNARVVMLTGTPIINKANEMGVLFNILRGYIYTYEVLIESDIDKSELKQCVKDFGAIDFVDYDNHILTVTRNPYGFSSNYKKAKYIGVNKGDLVQSLTDEDEFLRTLSKYLKKECGEKKKKTVTVKSTTKIYNKALPDTKAKFDSLYIDENSGLKDSRNLQRRIMGLTSYFRSAQENLLPSYDKRTDYHVVAVEMSQFQFSKYMEKIEAEKKDKNVGSDTYKMFTRLICNFAVENRPYPLPKENKKKDETNEDALIDAIYKRSQKRKDVDDMSEDSAEIDDLMNNLGKGTDYQERIVAKIAEMNDEPIKYFSLRALQQHSPKFKKIIENIDKADNIGLNLVYSQFRSFEGLTLFSLALDYNNFCQLKFHKVNLNWVIDETCMTDENIIKKKYAMYGEDNDEEKRELLKKVYNGEWSNFNDVLKRQLDEIFFRNRNANNSSPNSNNNFGEIIKVLMITSSGSEGINLFNTRYVHIMEPYWHPVRVQQVIGRARRICSHKNLPEEFRTIEVYIYIIKFTRDQKLTFITQLQQETTDEFLFRISLEKEIISDALTKAMKESSFDCNLYPHDPSEGLTCLKFGPLSTEYSYKPNYEDVINEQLERSAEQHDLFPADINGRSYLLEKHGKHYNVYDKADAERGVLKLLFKAEEFSKGLYKKMT